MLHFMRGCERERKGAYQTNQTAIFVFISKVKHEPMVKSVPRAVYIFHINKRGFEQIRKTFDSPHHHSVSVGVCCACISEWSCSILKDKSKNDVLRDYVQFMPVAGILHQFIYRLNNLYKIHIITLETFNDDYAEHKWINNYAGVVHMMGDSISLLI